MTEKEEVGEIELWTVISTIGWITGAIGSLAILYIMFGRPRLERELRWPRRGE